MKLILIMYFISSCCLLNAQPGNVYAKTLSEQRDEFIKIYSDTLNNLKATDSLPYFLSIKEFDLLHYSYWDNVHTPRSLRRDIINKVNNLGALKRILSSENGDYEGTYFVPKDEKNIYSEIYIPYSELSIKKLAQQRIEALEVNE